MNRDLSYSIFNPEYSWHNKNVRLTARNGNDTLSVTNEKGNLAISFNETTPERIITYSFNSTFDDYVNELTEVSYSYTTTFDRYIDELSDGEAAPSYTYEALFTDYIYELIEI